MTWTRLSDDFYDDDKITELSPGAFRLHVYGLVWCNKQLTDGLISMARVRRLMPEGDVEGLVAELVQSGLWAEVPGGNFQIDWSQQERAEDVRRRQEAAAERNRVYRRHKGGDHELCDPRTCAAARKRSEADASQDASRDASQDVSRDASRDSTRPSRPARPKDGTGEVAAGTCPDGHPPLDETPGYCLRRKPQPLHGPTWHRVVDGALDHIGALNAERDKALGALTAFLREHPEHETDQHLVEARLALL